MSKFDKIQVTAGDKIVADAKGNLQFSDRPIVAFIEGDGQRYLQYIEYAAVIGQKVTFIKFHTMCIN